MTMKTDPKNIDPDVPRFDNDSRNWNWELAVKECLKNDPADQGDGPYHALFIGSTFSVMPSGKYWTCWACSNVTEEEQQQDESYMELLELCAAAAGGWIESGTNGDYCDMFFCLPVTNDEEEFNHAHN